MSTTIDSKVVEMKFDNKQFESNVQTSLSTLDKLKRSLNMSDAAKGLEDVNSAAKKIDMGPLSNGVETVRAKFSALEVMAVTALANITNSAVNAGKRIASALTIDPIRTGFQEYETQINAIQTILANTQSKGTTLKDVTGALDELNHYADMTIYNFTEMTRNIGTFTAAGVDLDTSVSAIKGIANLAAVSGSTSQQASTAMYQLSQALASGTVKLMDWNSVVNAGMGGQVFQDALKETARVHNVSIDDMIKKEGSFRETLKDGWLTSEILTETLSKFTGDLTADQLKSMGYTEKQIDNIIKMGETANDAATKVKTFTQLFDTLKEAAQSGWTKSWEIIVGNFDEAKELLTSISDTISGYLNKSADARNNLLQGWKDLGGRQMAIESIKNVFQGILNIIKPIKEAFREIFPPMTAEKLAKITEGIRNMTEKFKDGTQKIEGLKATFKGLFSVIDIVVTVISKVVGGFVKLASSIIGFGKGIFGITGFFGNLISKFRDTIKESNLFGRAIDTVVKFLQNGINKVKEFISAITGKISAPGFEGFLGIINKIWDVLKTIGGKIASICSKIGSALVGVFRSGDLSNLLSLVNGGIISSILLGIRKFTNELKGSISNVAGITDILNAVKGCLQAFQNDLNAKALVKIAIAIGILSAAILLLSTIDPVKLATSLGAMAILFKELMSGLSDFSKMGKNIKKAGKTVFAMIGLSTAILILATALKKLGSLDIQGLAKGLIGIKLLIDFLIKATKSLKNPMEGVGSLILFAMAIKLLVSACTDLADLSWEGLAKGLSGVIVLIGSIVAAAKVLSKNKDNKAVIESASGFVLFAAAIKILASSCMDLASLSLGDLAKGLSGVVVLIGSVVAAAKILSKNKDNKAIIESASGFVVFSAAIKILASSCKDLSSLSLWDLAKGLTGVMVLVGTVVAAAKILSKNKDNKAVIEGASEFVIFAAAIKILASSCMSLASLTWGDTAKSLLGVVTLIGTVVAALKILSKSSGSELLKSASAILIMSAALGVLTPVLKTLGSMSWEGVAKGLVSIAGALTIMGVAGALLQPLIPTILALSAAILAFGIGCAAAGVGILALSAGLTALATAGVAGATAAVSAISIIILGIAELIPAIAEKIGEGIVAFCKVITDGAPAIAEAVKAVVLSVIDILVTCVPQIADGVLKMVVGVLEALVQYTPQIIDAVFNFLIAVLNGVAARLPELIQAAVNVVKAFFSGILDAFGSIDIDTLFKGSIALALITAVVAGLASIASMIPMAMVGVIGLGVIIGELALVLAAIGGLAQIPGLDWLINEGATLMQSIGRAIGGLVGGIVGGVMEGISGSLPQIATDLSNFMTNLQPFLDGISKVDSGIIESAAALAGVILALTAADILKRLTSWITGGSSLTQFAEELIPFGEAIVEFSSIVSGNINAEAVESASNAGKMLAEMAKTLPNSGGVLGFFVGENDLDVFAEKLVPFGEAITKFSSAVAGNVDVDAVTAAANAGKIMSEMANELPNSGGIISWFTGNNDMDEFAEKLIPFGESMAKFSSIVAGKIDNEAVTAAANAGKVMSEMATNLPNSGGIISWFTGNNDMDDFAAKLVPFGEAMAAFSSTVAGKIDSKAVTAAANAGRTISEMAKTLPNSGGIFSFFTGAPDLGHFAVQIAAFGEAMGSFSETISTKSFDPKKVKAASEVGKALADMTSALPNSGGFFSWFTGNKDPEGFKEQVGAFGEAIGSFSDAASKIKADNIEHIENVAKVGIALAKMTEASKVDVGGIFSFFTGVPDSGEITKKQIGNFGEAISGFADVANTIANKKINLDKIREVADIGKSLATMVGDTQIDVGGIFSFFTGVPDNGAIKKEQIDNLGLAIEGFATMANSKILSQEIDLDGIKKVADIGKTLAEMTKDTSVNVGSIFDWFTGSSDKGASFKESAGNFASGICNFVSNLTNSDSGVKVDSKSLGNIQAVADVGKTLAEMVGNGAVKNVGSIFEWFTGSSDNGAGFSEAAGNFGAGINSFATNVSGITEPDNVKAAAEVAKTLAEINSDGKLNTNYLTFASEALVGRMDAFGKAIKAFSDGVGGEFPGDNVIAAANAGKELLGLLSGEFDLGGFMGLDMDGLNTQLSGYATAIKNLETNLGEVNIDAINKSLGEIQTSISNVKSAVTTGLGEIATAVSSASTTVVSDAESMVSSAVNAIFGKGSDFNSAGQKLMDELVNGMNSKEGDMKGKAESLSSSAATGAKSAYGSFYSAGSYLVDGFAAGISENSYKAAAKASAMASAASAAAKAELGEQSPSKVFYKIGDFAGIGFINALADNQSNSYKAGSEMASYAATGLRKSFAKVRDIIDGNIDAQPVIRPVLDLSDIKSEAKSMDGIFGIHPSISLLSNVGKISSMMNGIQNETNDDVISAIKDLGRKIGGISGNTYNVNGVTYDDGSNISTAVKTLVRAARIERRI